VRTLGQESWFTGLLEGMVDDWNRTKSTYQSAMRCVRSNEKKMPRAGA
jgi:hypothetical protein